MALGLFLLIVFTSTIIELATVKDLEETRRTDLKGIESKEGLHYSLSKQTLERNVRATIVPCLSQNVAEVPHVWVLKSYS